MRLCEMGYATMRNGLCGYSKLAIRVVEIKKECTRVERVHPRYIVMIKVLVQGYYEYLRIIPGLILIFLRIWLSLQIWSMLTPRFFEMTERVSPLATL